MNKFATLGLASILVLGVATQSQAQYTKPIGMSMRIGLFYPSNGDARTVEGQGWFSGGLEYKMANVHFDSSKPNQSASWSLSLDYYGKGSYSNAPLLANYVFRNEQIYLSGGAGIGFGHVPATGGGSKTDTEFAFQLSVGYDFVKAQTPLFVELRYFGSSESKLTGFGIYGGIRF